MRIALLLAIVGTAACYATAPTYPDTGYATAPARAVQAMTTNGDDILVQQDARTGQFFIVSPESMRGEPVAVVNPNADPMLVTTDVRVRRHVVGSGGDEDRRDDRDHDRDHR